MTEPATLTQASTLADEAPAGTEASHPEAADAHRRSDDDDTFTEDDTNTLAEALEPLVADAIFSQGSPPSSDDDLARQVLEAVLIVSDEPVSARHLGEAVGRSAVEVEQLCEELAAQYQMQQRGFVLMRVAGGYRFQTNPEAAPYVEKFLLGGQSGRLSAAALETLAVVAYKQPISRTQIAAIRGVNVDGVMRTLESRGLVAQVARDSGPGKAVLYGTTREFLERLGIDSLDELAPLGQFSPDEETAKALEASLFSAAS